MQNQNTPTSAAVKTEKLQKVMAHAGVASRREAEKLISAGKVTVNQLPATIGQRINPQADLVVVNGKALALAPAHRYFLVNKPVGVVSTTSDELGRPTVLDILPKKLRLEAGRLYPVGRLDKDSQGLVLLTNDGALTQRMTHPKFSTQKTYHVQLDRLPTFKALQRLEQGVELKDGWAQVDSLMRLRDQYPEDEVWFALTVHEGRNRLIRRLWERLGYEVQTLIRVQLGPYSLEHLEAANQRWTEVDAPSF